MCGRVHRAGRHRGGGAGDQRGGGRGIPPAGLAALAERHRLIGDVRGEGLLLGVELVEDRDTRAPATGDAHRVRESMRDGEILLGTTGPAGNVLKIRPPLVFGREHADLLLQTLDEVLTPPGC